MTQLASDAINTYCTPPEVSARKVKTQICCTLGPGTQTKATLAKLLESGMGVARLNFSHGNHALYDSIVQNLREASAETGLHCGVMMDTRGSEIRIGTFANGVGVQLHAGQKFNFVAHYVQGDETQVTIKSWTLWQHMQPGDKVIVDYGLITFTVQEVYQRTIVTTVDNSNFFGPRKHCVVRMQNPPPNFRKTLLSYQDTVDIAFALKCNVDFVALSYAHSGEDFDEVRTLPGVVQQGVQLFAKIDSKVAIENFDSILDKADGVVLCRSELAVECPVEQVANIQKVLIKRCNHAGKPIVVINHILASMWSQPTPSRAEATDIANMVIDGADCLALTSPTASGKYPVEAVQVTRRIAREAEIHLDYRSLYVEMRGRMLALGSTDLEHSLASSVAKTAYDIEAALIIVFTRTGQSARNVAKYRPHCPLLCVTTSERVGRQLLLVRGCIPFVVGSMLNFTNGKLACLTRGNTPYLHHSDEVHFAQRT